MDNLEFNNVFGRPYIYKGINIYPIKMIEAPEFYDAIRCLLIEKNKFQDVEIIKMSYLKFLIEVGRQDVEYLILLEKLLNMIFKESVESEVDDRNKVHLIVNGIHLTEKDFDNIRKIIFKQNLIKIEEEILDPELERKLQEAREFMNKRGGKMASIEQQIVTYHCMTGKSYDEIANLTLYQFNKGIEVMNHIKTSDVLQNAQYNGFVSFKEGTNIPSFLSSIESKSLNDDLLMAKSDFDKLALEKGLVNK